jgi:hypothetical protein
MVAQGHVIEQDDIEVLTEMLESERKHHRWKRMLCVWLFAFWFVLLVVALGLVAMLTMGGQSSQLLGELTWLQWVTALAVAVMSSFSMICATQYCIHSIERTLFAARAGRPKLFETCLNQVECASKEKRRLWLDVVKDFIS